MMTADIVPTPLSIWNWGFKHWSGVLKQVTRDEIRLNLMPTAKASVSGEGIIFNKMRYSSDKAITEGWFEKARKQRWSETIQFDPRDVNHIYIGREKFYLTERDEAYKNFRLEEVREQQFVLEAQIQVLGTSKIQQAVDTDTLVKEIIEEETKVSNEYQTGLKSNTEKLKEIHQNRRNEKDHVREQEKWSDTLDTENMIHQTNIVEMKNYKIEMEDKQDDTDHLFNLIINQENERK